MRTNMHSRVAVVTGAAGGIGEALCRALGRAGARVALLDREAAAADATAKRLAAEGIDAAAFACDVTSPGDCERAVAAAAARFGAIDILVNNAGITHRGTFAETRVDVLRKVMEVNYFGAVHCTQAALPWILESRGSIVAVSSVAGFAPLVERAGYAASKHALHGLFDTLRTELDGKGVHVMLVCPSFTRTGIGAHALDPSGGTRPSPWTTTGRLLEPEEVAAAIVDGIARRRRVVTPSLTGRVAWYLSRLAPALYDRIMLRSLRATEAAAPATVDFAGASPVR